MAYSLVAIGWVPNMDDCITSEENISVKLKASQKRMGFQFIPNGRRIIVKNGKGERPFVVIQLMDDTGLCHIFVDNGSEPDGSTEWDDSNNPADMALMTAWMTFRGLIDNTADPEYAQPDDGSYSTGIAEAAVCSAMNTPILISELTNPDGWADAIVKRFTDNYNATLDLIRKYPKKYRYWSNPNHFWNRRKVIDRSTDLFTKASTDCNCCRSFVNIYSDKISAPRTGT